MPKLPPNAVHPHTLADWRQWLEQHHTQTDGVWLVSFKKATGRQAFDYAASVEEALCFGWVDSKGNKLDDERTMLWFAPRQPGSGWSRPNKERIERLSAAGRMAPAGLAKIAAAKRDGTWAKLDAVEALEVPPDLAAALAANPTAQQYFEAFPRSAKRALLEWLVNAKKPETRAKRVAEIVTQAAHNQRANQWRPPGQTGEPGTAKPNGRPGRRSR